MGGKSVPSGGVWGGLEFCSISLRSSMDYCVPWREADGMNRMVVLLEFANLH